MSAAGLLEEIGRYGASVVLDSGQLKVRAPAPIPDELFEQLRASKAELVALIGPNQRACVEPSPDSIDADRIEALTEALTEKAGAFINDGFDQAEADRRAVEVVQCRACRHYQPDVINPDGGMGTCQVSAWPLSFSAVSLPRRGMAPWPHAPRRCEAFQVAGADAPPAPTADVLRLNCEGFRFNGK